MIFIIFSVECRLLKASVLCSKDEEEKYKIREQNMIEHVTVFVGNIPYEMLEAELEALFLESGLNVVSVMIEMDERERSRGFGFVTLASIQDAEQAIEKLNRKEVGKLKLRVNLARADSHYLKADK